MDYRRHLARARELLDRKPKPGEQIQYAYQRMVEAHWEIAEAHLKILERLDRHMNDRPIEAGFCGRDPHDAHVERAEDDSRYWCVGYRF